MCEILGWSIITIVFIILSFIEYKVWNKFKREKTEIQKNEESNVFKNKHTKNICFLCGIGIIIFIILISSITYGVILIPFPEARGISRSTWVSFWGSILGGVIGGLITLYVLSKTLKQNKEQLNKTLDQNKKHYIDDKIKSVKPHIIIKNYIDKTEQAEVVCILDKKEYIDIKSIGDNFRFINVGNGVALNIEIKSVKIKPNDINLNSNFWYMKNREIQVENLILQEKKSMIINLYIDEEVIEKVEFEIEFKDLYYNSYRQSIEGVYDLNCKLKTLYAYPPELIEFNEKFKKLVYLNTTQYK